MYFICYTPASHPGIEETRHMCWQSMVFPSPSVSVIAGGPIYLTLSGSDIGSPRRIWHGVMAHGEATTTAIDLDYGQIVLVRNDISAKLRIYYSMDRRINYRLVTQEYTEIATRWID